MPQYIRAFAPGGTFFFTVNLLERHRTLLTDQIAKLHTAFDTVRKQKPFVTEAYVILPDHMHCIWKLPDGDSDFSSRWQAIKAHFSRHIPTGERLSVRRLKKGERGIWQRRFWEHMIRDERDFAQHFDYIHFNPVKHRHVKAVHDWPHSSFHEYVRRGIYTANWAAENDVQNLDKE